MSTKRKPYKKPQITTEKIFENTVLTCVKHSAGQPWMCDKPFKDY